MYTTKVIKVDSFTSSKSGKPFKLVWFSDENGLPCKTFVGANFDANQGDAIKISVETGFDCVARLNIKKA